MVKTCMRMQDVGVMPQLNTIEASGQHSIIVDAEL